jgi:hypothetical protein
MVKITGKFNFLVARGGNFGDGTFEVGLHGGAHGIELDADVVNFVGGCESPAWARCSHGCGNGCLKEGASIHGRIVGQKKENGN